MGKNEKYDRFPFFKKKKSTLSLAFPISSAHSWFWMWHTSNETERQASAGTESEYFGCENGISLLCYHTNYS